MVGGRIVDSNSDFIPVFSTASSSSTRPFSRNHTMTAFDYGKVSILLIITILCFWSYFDKFYISSSSGSGFKKITIDTDYQACMQVSSSQHIAADQRDAMTQQCRVEIAAAYQTAKHECKGYLANLNSCREAHVSNCAAQVQTTESCYQVLTDPTTAKWNRIARTGSSS